MTEPLAFFLAVLALLATPGPTNTLLAASGATAGFWRSLPLVIAEGAGYLLALVILIGLLGPVAADHAGFAMTLKLAASLWLAWCALRLWREARAGFSLTGTPVTVRRLFVTTALNPKALIFAFVIFPAGPLLAVGPWLAGFLAVTAVCGTAWIGVGVLVGRSVGIHFEARRIWQAAAVVLAVFAVVVAGSAMAAG